MRNGIRILFSFLCITSIIFSFVNSALAQECAEAFMSATFGLSAKRTQLRMEGSGALASGFIKDGRLSMTGLFEGRPTIFAFVFHDKKGLKYKAAYLTSTGKASEDFAFYSSLRDAYNMRFGSVQERPLPSLNAGGRVMYRNVWTPDKNSTITLSYDPEATNRFPGDSPAKRPIHLIYDFSKW